MKNLLKMAWRNIWRNKRRAALLLSAMTAGLAGVLFSLGVATGWMDQMLAGAVNTYQGHVKITAEGYLGDPVIERNLPVPPGLPEELHARPEVTGWAERVAAQGLLSTADQSLVVRIVGIDPEPETRVSVLADSIREGDYLGAGSRNRILIGRRLAEKLDRGPGKKVVLMAQQQGGELGSAAFRIGGIFDTGNASFDEGTVYVPLEEAQRMLNLGDRVTEIVVVLDDIGRSEAVAADLADRLAGRPVEVTTWKDRLPLIVETMTLSRRMMIPYYGIFYIAMAFGMVNTLLMAIGERTHEIGVMLAIGMRRRRLVGLILLESLLIAVVASVVGMTAGWGLVAWFGHRGIDLGELAAGVEYLGVGKILRPRLDGSAVVTAGVAAWAVAIVFSIYPALRAARLTPIEAVRRP